MIYNRIHSLKYQSNKDLEIRNSEFVADTPILYGKKSELLADTPILYGKENQSCWQILQSFLDFF